MPGDDFDFYSLEPSVQHALDNSVRHGPRLLKAANIADFVENEINGWYIILKDIGFYGVHYVKRAMIAMTGLRANLPQDAVYGPNFIDSDGNLLAGTDRYITVFLKANCPRLMPFGL